MKRSILCPLLLMAVCILLQKCKSDERVAPGAKKEISRIEEVLDGNDRHLAKLLDKVRGSVGKRGPASKTIWSRKNQYGLGLYISASHVYGLNGRNTHSPYFLNLFTDNPGIFETSQMPPTNGTIATGNMLIADFPLMHFYLSPGATNTSLIPAEDFYLGIIDNQRTEQVLLAKYPDSVQTNIPLEMYDPAGRTSIAQTWAHAVEGETVIAVGYPQDKVNYPNGAAVAGKILPDLSAMRSVEELKIAGDAEGDIPYDQEVEFFVAAKGISGMSGGGVFNAEGQLLGIMVRASESNAVQPIIRVVRVAYIRSKMLALYNGLPEAERSTLTPFLSGELE